MAFIGLRHPVYARITEFEDGAMPCYAVPVVAGRAIQANVTKTHNNTPLYADDIIDEDDNSITGMTLTVGLNDLDDEKRRWLLGDIMSYEQGVGNLFDEGGEDAEESQTKGESIEWKTPTITGRVKPIYADDSGIPKFRRRKTFDTQAEAEAWLDAVAGYDIPANLALQFLTTNATLKPTFKQRHSEYEATIEVPVGSLLYASTVSATPQTGQTVSYEFEDHTPEQIRIVISDQSSSKLINISKNESWSAGDTGDLDLYVTVEKDGATAVYHVLFHIVIKA